MTQWSKRETERRVKADLAAAKVEFEAIGREYGAHPGTPIVSDVWLDRKNRWL